MKSGCLASCSLTCTMALNYNTSSCATVSPMRLVGSAYKVEYYVFAVCMFHHRICCWPKPLALGFTITGFRLYLRSLFVCGCSLLMLQNYRDSGL